MPFRHTLHWLVYKPVLVNVIVGSGVKAMFRLTFDPVTVMVPVEGVVVHPFVSAYVV